MLPYSVLVSAKNLVTHSEEVPIPKRPYKGTHSGKVPIPYKVLVTNVTLVTRTL